MWIDEDLPSQVSEEVQALCAEGDELAERHMSREAILTFSKAFKLLPEPRQQWLAATWILTAIGDTAFLHGDLRTATEAFAELGRDCEGWHGNAFIRLRRGQIAYENGDMKQASNELASAFMLGGYEIFDSVDEKYPRFVLAQMHPPVPPEDHPLARFHLQP